MVVVAVLLFALGALGVVAPLVGPPLIGLGTGPESIPLIEVRLVRSVLPGVATIAGGALLLPRARAARRLGAGLGVAGGIWFAVSPVVHGHLSQSTSRFVEMFGILSYHYGTGVLIAALAGFALGHLTPGRAAPVDRPPDRTDQPEPQ